jgi:hypothetical protein
LLSGGSGAGDTGNAGALVMALADLVREEGSLDLGDCDAEDIAAVYDVLAPWPVRR